MRSVSLRRPTQKKPENQLNTSFLAACTLNNLPIYNRVEPYHPVIYENRQKLYRSLGPQVHGTEALWGS